jgi:predicted nucleotidyltransferase
MGGVKMKEKIKKIINQVFEERGIKVERIILFGSRARGDFKENSDWDLLIIVEEKLSRDERVEILHLIRRKLADEFIPSDVIIKSREEVEERQKVIGSVIKSAMEEGILL